VLRARFRRVLPVASGERVARGLLATGDRRRSSDNTNLIHVEQLRDNYNIKTTGLMACTTPEEELSLIDINKDQFIS
jgi:hypothetical protein